ncbi:NADH-quinone oxidoreductase subunit C [Hydrogenimonas urashimensis]|uniref:NADH-quinone oxidoreductase subunit D-related protein n=1 Tax=Hydrogenimonas urashimensis TaxID=2740515 RepID=UPI00191554F8|nr:NADH-quinone oxidoreductase subunit C [Hydrogenimonas urashimensis]
MERIKERLKTFSTEYVEEYKPTWIKTKLTDAKDIVALAASLKSEGLRTLSTVSPTDFPEEGIMEMNYFFEDLEGRRNCWVKCDIPRDLESCVIDSVTPVMPSAEWHEREAFSMFGVKFRNHPDLRPIIISQDYYGKFPFRSDFDWEAHEKEQMEHIKTIVRDFKSQQQTNEIELDPEGSEVILNWGPTHPASGPIRLKVRCDGEDIVAVDPEIGYVWRALEDLVTRKDFVGAIVAVERLCFMDNINSMTGYCMAVEEIAGTEITEFAKWMRVLLGECARISSHMMGMGNFFNTMGLHTMMLWNLDVREFFLDVLESYSGARIATAAIEPGGVRYPLDMKLMDELQRALDKFDATIGDIENVFAKNPTMRKRATQIGKIGKDEAIEWGLSGPVARASGVKTDIRMCEPYAAYDQVDMGYRTQEGGTAADRFQVLFDELKQSVDILRQAKRRIEEGVASKEFDPARDHMVKVPKKLPAGEAISRVEWARGEVLMHLVTREKAKSPYRLKMRAPSVNHTMVLDRLLRGKTLSDIPLVFGSLYICQGDLDR